MVGCPNVYIKIPATHESIPSIKEVISLGISVNVTVSLLFMNILILKKKNYHFSLQHQYAYIVCVFEQLIFSLPTYEAVINAYLDGLEASSNTDLSKVSSAAAFYISRVDVTIDKKLEQIGTAEALDLTGKV
jgi:transaldolase